MHFKRIFVIFSLFLCSCLNSVVANKLLYLLVDGFRWDYFNLPGLTLKGFPRIFREGTKAEWMTPDFPTNSFPNYKTLETGLHVESHGVVGNYMYNEETGGNFKLTLDNPESFDPKWWSHAESFFTTAERQGIHTGLYFVRGCDISINGVIPTYCLPYSGTPTVRQAEWAIKDAFSKMGNNTLDIAYIYYENVDTMGHYHGPNSAQVKQEVQAVDSLISKMLDTLKENNKHSVNIIIVSDHGMASIDELHMINITSVLNMEDIVEVTEGGSQAYIWPAPGRTNFVYSRLKPYHPHLRVYLREELHDRWFFKKHTLIPPVFLTTDRGWFIVHPKSSDKYFQTTGGVWSGNHGFDNDDMDMKAIFVAYGPDFKKNYTAKSFSNINVYQLICHVTGIKARPHNGTWSDVKDMLIEDVFRDEL